MWGLDFLGYGRSPRRPLIDGPALGLAALPEGQAAIALPQLRLAINHIRSVNGGQPVDLIAHSWGTIPALQFAAHHANQVGKLVLFGAIAPRKLNLTVPAMGGTRILSVWEQYRRFIEDVPKGQPQVLSDQNMQEWVTAHLQTPRGAAPGVVPSVVTPNGPLIDIMETWSDKPVYDLAQVQSPTLLVRGEWDSVSSEADTAVLMQALGSTKKRNLTIPKATHLMHLEFARTTLYLAVNTFLGEP